MNVQMTLYARREHPLIEYAAPDSAPMLLIVDDDPNLRNLLCSVLAEVHPTLRVVGVATSQQALLVAAEARPNLLLLDYHLWGSALNGIELYDALAQGGPIPAIMISSDLPREELNIRHIPCIAKPFDLDALLADIAGQLAGQAGVVPAPALAK